MERPKFTYRVPEIPSGRAGLDTVLELVNQVLLENPAIASRQERLLTPDRVKTDSLENIQALEEKQKPLESLRLSQALELAGVPEEFIKSKAYYVSTTQAYYFNITQKEPSLYIAGQYLEALSLADRPQRYEWVINLGLVFIQASFESAIKAANLPNRLRGVAKPQFVHRLEEDLLAEVLRQPKFKVIKQDLEVAKDGLKEVMAPDEGPKKARFLRYGARLFLVGPNRVINQNDYGIGQNFDSGVYCYLASPVMQRWVDLVETKYMASHRKVPGEVFKRADLAKPTLARISLLDRGRLMEAYFDSTIPVTLLDELSSSSNRGPELASRGYPR